MESGIALAILTWSCYQQWYQTRSAEPTDILEQIGPMEWKMFDPSDGKSDESIGPVKKWFRNFINRNFDSERWLFKQTQFCDQFSHNYRSSLLFLETFI